MRYNEPGKWHFGRPRLMPWETPYGVPQYRDYREAGLALTHDRVIFTRVEKGVQLSSVIGTPWEVILHTPPASFSAARKKMNAAMGRALHAESKEALIEAVAELHWWGAHMTPFNRGSAAVTDILAKALLRRGGVKPGKWRKGVGADLEAMLLEREEFIRRYPAFFR